MMMMVKLISDVYGSLRFQFRVIFLFSFFETWNRASSNKTVDVINQPGWNEKIYKESKKEVRK